MSVLDRIARVGRRRRRRAPAVPAERLDRLEERVSHLENMLEGFQDSVHREITRMNLEADQLRERTEPAEIRRSLSDDARIRGL
jgi:uncharacterized coiled-coil protein SlyX